MKLFIKRNISADNNAFVVFDDLGKEKYRIDFKKKKPPLNLEIKDLSGNVVSKIRQLPIVGANAFVFKAGKTHITFVMILTQNNVRSYFYGNNWHIAGSIITKEFSIIDVDNSVISSQKKCGDAFELTIADCANELYCIAASICVCMVNTVDNLAIQTV